jgi:hypothetical protein
LLIIDDLIKPTLEANNAAVLEKHWEWFTNTMFSRLEEGAKVIIVMTRWHSEDLAGKALEFYTESGVKAVHIRYKALQDDGSMLCPEILSLKSYKVKIKAKGADIASANYQQEPIDIKGRLYSQFLTYENIPEFECIQAYTDTADTGKDYLCSIVYGVYHKQVYVLDVLYTKDNMSITEQTQADIFDKNKVNVAVIESNNGGRGFARVVKGKIK